VGLQWYGVDIVDRTNGMALQGCLAGAIHLRDAIQVKIAIIGPPRSQPGEAPHVDTGALRGSIEIIPIPAGQKGYSVGSGLDYAVYLELGTRKMDPRPFMTVTALEEMDATAQMVAAGARSGGTARLSEPTEHHGEAAPRTSINAGGAGGRIGGKKKSKVVAFLERAVRIATSLFRNGGQMAR